MVSDPQLVPMATQRATAAASSSLKAATHAEPLPSTHFSLSEERHQKEPSGGFGRVVPHHPAEKQIVWNKSFEATENRHWTPPAACSRRTLVEQPIQEQVTPSSPRISWNVSPFCSFHSTDIRINKLIENVGCRFLLSHSVTLSFGTAEVWDCHTASWRLVDLQKMEICVYIHRFHTPRGTSAADTRTRTHKHSGGSGEAIRVQRISPLVFMQCLLGRRPSSMKNEMTSRKFTTTFKIYLLCNEGMAEDVLTTCVITA